MSSKNKQDIDVEEFADGSVAVHLLSEDAKAWVEDNICPNFTHGTLNLPADRATATLDQMREDGLT